MVRLLMLDISTPITLVGCTTESEDEREKVRWMDQVHELSHNMYVVAVHHIMQFLS